MQPTAQAVGKPNQIQQAPEGRKTRWHSTRANIAENPLAANASARTNSLNFRTLEKNVAQFPIHLL
jgi:hypothetical protein